MRKVILDKIGERKKGKGKCRKSVEIKTTFDSPLHFDLK